jgi:CRISPR-associated exonuclease Cas4
MNHELFSILCCEAEQRHIYGLLFQHIVLCPTRTWLHYHRIDCYHLNRHMKMGLWLHETAYGGESAEPYFGAGIAPDMLDFAKREVSEVKKSKSHEAAAISQLRFYVAVMQEVTGEPWVGILRYPNARRTKRIALDKSAQLELLEAFAQIKAVIEQPLPPEKVEKTICTNCSYRILCWGLGTEDEDY